jgi:hypothetical protein
MHSLLAEIFMDQELRIGFSTFFQAAPNLGWITAQPQVPRIASGPGYPPLWNEE